MLPKFIFILGTGRSGSWTAFRLFQANPECEASHEGFPLPWEADPCTFYYLFMKAMVGWGPAKYFVSSAFIWLPYANLIMKNLKDPRMVVLTRDREATIESFLKHWEFENYWTDPESKHWDGQFGQLRLGEPDPDLMMRMFPKYDLPKADAIGAYWDDYMAAATYWQRRLPDNFAMMDMEYVLNSRIGQRHFFNFCGIPLVKHKYFVGCKLNDKDNPMGILYRETMIDVHTKSRIYETPEVLRSEA